MDDARTARLERRRSAAARIARLVGLAVVALIAAGTVMAAPAWAPLPSAIPGGSAPAASATPSPAPDSPSIRPRRTPEVPVGAPGGIPGHHVPK